MRLMDQIAQANEPIFVRDPDGAKALSLPGSNVMASTLKSCPLRYILHDDIVETCIRIGFEPAGILHTAVDLLRCPARRLWVEFNGPARNRAYGEKDRLAADALRWNQRLGLLIESDASGRQGTIQSCWESPQGRSPEIAPFIAEFDFDQAAIKNYSQPGVSGHRRASCVEVRMNDFPALESLFRHICFRFRPEWHDYYQRRCNSQTQYENIVQAALKPVVEDVPLFASLMLLLMAHNAVKPNCLTLAKLNASRTKRGKTALLDHVELTLELGGTEGQWAIGRPGHNRAASRLHTVRGHLVRRGDAIFWRNTHLRGSAARGVIANRTISLRFAAE